MGQVRASCGPGEEALTHEPVAGAVSQDSAKVWVRSCTTANISIEYKQISQDWSQSQTTGNFQADTPTDYTVAITVQNLNPKTAYNFRVKVDDQLPSTVSSGKFKTMPADGTSNQLHFTMGTDLHFPQNPELPIVPSMAAQNPDFTFFIGDNVVIDDAQQSPRPMASTADYENLYKETWLFPNFSSLRANIPSFMMWDDHEIINGWDQPQTTLPFPYARAAYEEYINSYQPQNRTPGNVNYSVKAGDVEFYVLDTRSTRSPDENPDDTNKTMLGSAQKQDLKDWLLNSKGRFKFLVSSVWWNNFSTHSDSWAQYLTERDEIFNFIKDNKVSGVILISGDEHSTAISKLSPSGLYEFTPGPMNWAVGKAQPNPQILYTHFWVRSFGLFDTNTNACPGTISMQLKDYNGLTRYTLNLDENQLFASNLNSQTIDLPSSIAFDDITNPIGDNKPDTCDPDIDHDGLTDTQEQQAGTDPKNQDSDGDGIPDGAEKSCNTSPLSKQSTLMIPLGNGIKMPDKDNDTLPDYCETILGTNPNLADTDGDGLIDGAEVNWGANPLVQDTDQDGCKDDLEAANLNNDKIINSTDQLIIAQRFNAARGSANYVKDFDINQDGRINSTDQLIIAQRFNKTCP